MRAVTRSRTEPGRFARELFDGLPARYDLLVDALSFGQNHRWRSAMASAVTSAEPAPATVLDVATGTAGVALMLTRRSRARVTGVDITEAMVRRGRSRVAEHGDPGRVRLLVGRAERLPFADESFDALTFTYLLRYVSDPAATLKELARVVRPGGPVASLEFAVPESAVTRAAWRLYTRAFLPVLGLIAGGREWFEVGRFLGPSIDDHYRRYDVDWTVRAWQDAGIESVQTRSMSLGGGLVMWGRKSAAGAAARG